MIPNAFVKPTTPAPRGKRSAQDERSAQGSAAKRPCHGSAGGTSTLFTRKTGAEPPPTASLLGLLSCGRELAQRIAWFASTPTYLGSQRRSARAIGRTLSSLARSHPDLAQCLSALLRMARWSYELTRLFVPHQLTRPVPIDFLLSDPAAAPRGQADDGLQIPVPPLHTQRLEALLRACRSPGATQDKCRLLKALFLAHLAQIKPDPNTTAQATHLPLLDLPRRVITRELTLHPHLQRHEDLQQSPGGIQHPPLHALVSSLPLLEPGLRFLLLFSFSLAFGQWDGSLVAGIRQHVQRHVPDAQELAERILLWWQGFLDAPDEQIDPALAREVLETLGRAPVLGMEACMRLLARLCNSPRLRALATDEPLCTLIHRAMSEVDTELHMIDRLRIDYLFSSFPADLGVAAFNRLSPEQRLAFVEHSQGLAIQPYMQAVLTAEDIDHGLARAALEDMVQRLHDEEPEHLALPGLRELQAQMAQADGLSQH